MLKYEFDQDKKIRFLNFWQLKKVEEYALLEDNLLSFAFKFSNVYSFNKNIATIFASIIEAVISSKYLVLKDDVFIRSSVGLLSVAIDKAAEEVVFLEDINIFSWIKDKKHLSIGTDFLQLSPLFLKYLLEIQQIPIYSKDSIRKDYAGEVEDDTAAGSEAEDSVAEDAPVQGGNILFFSKLAPGVTRRKKSEEAVWKERPWLKLNTGAKKLLQKIYELQAIPFTKLSEKNDGESVQSLLNIQLIVLTRDASNCEPILLFNAAVLNNAAFNSFISKEAAVRKEALEKKQEIISKEKLADKIFLEPQKQIKRFVEIFLAAQLMVAKKNILTFIPETFGRDISKARETFVKTYIVEKLIKKSVADSFLTLPFTKKCSYFLLAVMGKYTNLFLDFCFLASLPGIEKNILFFEEKSEPSHFLQNATLLNASMSINRLRIFLGKRTFSEKVYKKMFWLLSRISLVSFIDGRLCYNEKMLLSLYSLMLDSINKEAWRYSFTEEDCIIDSDMTITAYRDTLQLESIVFLSLFCKLSVSEHILRFVPFSTAATFSWYSGVGKEAALKKLQELGGSTYSAHVKNYYAVFFEYAKGVIFSTVQTLKFSSQHFFQLAKHLLIEEEDVASNVFFAENQYCIFFLTEESFSLAKTLLQEKKLIRGSS